MIKLSYFYFVFLHSLVKFLADGSHVFVDLSVVRGQVLGTHFRSDVGVICADPSEKKREENKN